MFVLGFVSLINSLTSGKNQELEEVRRAQGKGAKRVREKGGASTTSATLKVAGAAEACGHGNQRVRLKHKIAS